MNTTRREFLKQMSALSIAGVATPLALNLSAISQASAATASDYKAIVCVFLYGGNDNTNTLVPYDLTSYNAYQAARPDLAYARESLTPLTPTIAPELDVHGEAHQYALATELAPLKPLFDSRKMAVMLNLGPLVRPTTKTEFTNRIQLGFPIPPKLFSHNDQQSVWQALKPEGAITGWGGRLGDLAMPLSLDTGVANNTNSTFTCINVSSNAVFVSGNNAIQYKISPTGATPMTAARSPLFGSPVCQQALYDMINQSRTHLLEKEYNKIGARALGAFDAYSSALNSPSAAKINSVGETQTGAINTVFPNESLASQLKFVARSISVAQELSVKRQVFFVSIGGFDNHGTLKADHAKLLTKVSEALRAFYDATVELGIQNRVTTFTASDFGRTLTSNNEGSDHGWGSVHFVLGGAVNGGRFYGKPPVVAVNGPDDVTQGRFIPTTSVEQYAATLGAWFGASASDLNDIFPNLRNFNQANLGFV